MWLKVSLAICTHSISIIKLHVLIFHSVAVWPFEVTKLHAKLCYQYKLHGHDPLFCCIRFIFFLFFSPPSRYLSWCFAMKRAVVSGFCTRCFLPHQSLQFSSSKRINQLLKWFTLSPYEHVTHRLVHCAAHIKQRLEIDVLRQMIRLSLLDSTRKKFLSSWGRVSHELWSRINMDTIRDGTAAPFYVGWENLKD